MLRTVYWRPLCHERHKELIMKIIRLQEVIQLTGLARSTVYKFIKDQSFPRQVSLGGRSVGWVESEIQAWIAEKIADRDK